MSKSLPKMSCYNTPETVLLVTELDDEGCDRTIDDEIGEELSGVNLPLSDGENDDLMESGDSEEQSEDLTNNGSTRGRTRFFRPRIQNRLVKDNGSALDDLLPIPSETEETGIELDKNKKNKKKFLDKAKV